MIVAADFIFIIHKERLVLKEQHFVVLKKRPIRSLKKYIQYY